MSSLQFGPAKFIPGCPPPSLQLADACVAKIKPHDASKLMAELADKAPLGRFSHLKRIRKTEAEAGKELTLILCVLERDLEGLEAEQYMPQQVQEVVEKYKLEPYTVQVSC